MKLNDWLLVLVLSSTGTFLGMVFTVVAPVLPLIIQHFGGPVQGAFVGQWILAIPSIGIVFGGVVMGWFSERLGARLALFVAFTVFALIGAAGMFIANADVLLVSRLIVGLAASAQVTAATMIIGEQFTNAQRGQMLGIQNAVAVLLGVFFTLAAGAIGQSLGWRAPFGLYLVSLTMLLLGIFVVRPSVRLPAGARIAGDYRFSLLLPLLPLYAMMALTFMNTFFTSFVVPRLLAQDGFTSPDVISLVIGCGTAFFAAGAFLYGSFRARFGVPWTFALGLGGQGAGVLWIALAHGPLSLGIGAALINIGAGVQTPNISHLILDRAPLSVRGRAVGLLFSAQFMGPFLESALVAPFMVVFGIRVVLLVIGALLILSVAAIALRVRFARQKTKEELFLENKNL